MIVKFSTLSAYNKNCSIQQHVTIVSTHSFEKKHIFYHIISYLNVKKVMNYWFKLLNLLTKYLINHRVIKNNLT